ncbi:MAG: hypothetical protein HY859_02630 [Caulobacterales bacterium]|nr:hypothetical protein [Caulobacterales bacterium]
MKPIHSLALALSAMALLGGCMSMAVASGRANGQLSAGERAQCRAKGGTVGLVGMFGTPACIIPYSDAGKACRDGSDCQGQCIVDLDGPPGSGPKPGDQTTGQCQKDDQQFGCFATVVDGKAAQALCVD